MFDYDAELRLYHSRLMQAAAIQTDARVLDIGCGAGLTTRDAARAAPTGEAVGIDISEGMLARARHLTGLEGVANARFEVGDAQDHPLPTGRYTVGLSRFGTMFFADPVVAFTNIARALRPGARLLQLVWQDAAHQEWNAVTRQALHTGPETPAPTGRGAFSLSDPAELDAVLTAAGFVDVRPVDVREPVFYGSDTEAALSAMRSVCLTDETLRGLDDISTARAVDRLRHLLEARDNSDGVWFGSRAWLVSARRR